jgi:hypothetical protein
MICIVGLAALAGCVTRFDTIVFDRPGLTAAELDRDKARCGEQSSRPRFFGGVGLDHEAYLGCMRTLGYTTERIVGPR